MTIDLKTVSTWVGILMTVGGVIWGAARLSAKVDRNFEEITELKRAVETANEERARAWAVACSAADIPMEKCF